MLDPCAVADRRRDGVLVVLEHEDHGKVPDGGQVHGLVPHPVGRRTVAAEREHDLRTTTLLDGKCGTRSDPEATGNDAIGSQVADRPTRDVHRTAAAMAVAGLLA